MNIVLRSQSCSLRRGRRPHAGDGADIPGPHRFRAPVGQRSRGGGSAPPSVSTRPRHTMRQAYAATTVDWPAAVPAAHDDTVGVGRISGTRRWGPAPVPVLRRSRRPDSDDAPLGHRTDCLADDGASPTPAQASSGHRQVWPPPRRRPPTRRPKVRGQTPCTGSNASARFRQACRDYRGSAGAPASGGALGGSGPFASDRADGSFLSPGLPPGAHLRSPPADE